MHILFANDHQIPIELTNSPVQDTLLSIYKNLQHVPVHFNEWDSPFYFDNNTFEDVVNRVCMYGHRLEIDVDPAKCGDQQYINQLHRIYEKNYNGSDNWLEFHETLHHCEEYNYRYPGNCAVISYREKAGPLEKPFDFSWLSGATTQIRAGDVFLGWAELGKTPYEYWRTGEPNNIDRLCEFAKPWLKLRFRISIATEDADTLDNKQVDDFNKWFAQYKTEWCAYWNLSDWSINDVYSPIVFGRIDPINPFLDLLKQHIHPKQIRL
jgi:hypothetical protein